MNGLFASTAAGAAAAGCRVGPRRLACSAWGPASLVRLADDRPGVRDRAQVPELVRGDHRVDPPDPPAEDVEGPGVEHLAVPIAEDRARLAVHLPPFDHAADPGERLDDRGGHPGHVLGADDAPGP